MVCGITDATYRDRVADAAIAVRFRPRLVGGRAVVAPALMVYNF
jgi:hypothetical protein